MLRRTEAMAEMLYYTAFAMPMGLLCVVVRLARGLRLLGLRSLEQRRLWPEP